MPPRALPKLKSAALRGKVDVAMITMREDEEDAVLSRFPAQAICAEVPCSISYVTVEGAYYTTAVARCLRQGANEAQKVTETLIQKLAPSWIVVVGIAGAVPDNEFTLGDVVIANLVYDLTVSAAKQGRDEYSLAGGFMSPSVEKVLAGLRARKVELQGWSSKAAVRATRPPMDLKAAKCYGAPAFQKHVLESLHTHFAGKARPPKFTVRPIVSSNALVHDTNLVKYWKGIMRHFAAIEMEFAGVYVAAKGRGKNGTDVPVFTVRGISDVVGLKRQGSGDWTNYARNTAAAFTKALVAGSFLGSPRHGEPPRTSGVVAIKPNSRKAEPPPSTTVNLVRKVTVKQPFELLEYLKLELAQAGGPLSRLPREWFEYLEPVDWSGQRRCLDFHYNGCSLELTKVWPIPPGLSPKPLPIYASADSAQRSYHYFPKGPALKPAFDLKIQGGRPAVVTLRNKDRPQYALEITIYYPGH
jgi:nucleoside phosphorylase